MPILGPKQHVQIGLRKEERNGVSVCEDVTPDGWRVVWSHTPSITPWDYYGVRAARETRVVLGAYGIPTILLESRCERINPMGSGQGGRVRFGDSMMPTTYSVAVEEGDTAMALKAIEAHKEQVRQWLDGKAPKPAALSE
jgi:hypothetical protein